MLTPLLKSAPSAALAAQLSPRFASPVLSGPGHPAVPLLRQPSSVSGPWPRLLPLLGMSFPRHLHLLPGFAYMPPCS